MLSEPARQTLQPAAFRAVVSRASSTLVRVSLQLLSSIGFSSKCSSSLNQVKERRRGGSTARTVPVVGPE
jgi:hypothetical protein